MLNFFFSSLQLPGSSLVDHLLVVWLVESKEMILFCMLGSFISMLLLGVRVLSYANGWPNGCSFQRKENPTVRSSIVLRIVMLPCLHDGECGRDPRLELEPDPVAAVVDVVGRDVGVADLW